MPCGALAACDSIGQAGRMEITRTLDVEKLASGGDGLAFDDGKAVFIPFSVPGERVEVRTVLNRRDFDRAEIVSVLATSPDRVIPQCPAFGRCGGCSLQHMSHESQTREKARAVREAFVHFAGFDPGGVKVSSGAAYGYRNRLQVHVCDDGGFGFMPEGGPDSGSGAVTGSGAVRVKGCPVADAAAGAWLGAQNRKARPARELAAAYGERPRFVVFSQEGRLYVEGRDAFAEARVAGRHYRFSTGHFFQSNLEMAEILLSDALEGLSGRRAADLYSGAGLFSVPLAERFAEIHCVESDAVSLEAARANLRPAGGGRAIFHPMSVERWIESRPGRSAGEANAGTWDWVLADPPRQGFSDKVRRWLAEADIGGISYVSCDPVTMARDIGALAGEGQGSPYVLESLALYDFYPQTGHFEALARLRRRDR